MRRRVTGGAKGDDTMKQLIRRLAVFVACALLALPRLAAAQATTAIPPAITTPDKVDSRIGTLDFKDGMPSQATLERIYDNLDFTHAFEAFVNTIQGVNAAAIRKGFLDIGVQDNEVLVFSKLMDAKSLFLTANADTAYAGHTPRLPARWQPELSVVRRRTERRRLHDGVLRSEAARRRQAGQLDPDDARQGLVCDPAPLQPTRAVLYEGVAAERDRDGSMSLGQLTPSASIVSLSKSSGRRGVRK